MAGYWNRPDETAKVMTADNFFKTGDMGFMDDKGYTKIVDRKKDMILVSGFNVYPNELEEVVAQHPGVLEVAAIGVPDEKSGEVPKLFIVKKDAALTDKDVLDFCRKNMTGYKVPRFVEFRTELPKSPVGKILRKDLRIGLQDTIRLDWPGENIAGPISFAGVAIHTATAPEHRRAGTRSVRRCWTNRMACPLLSSSKSSEAPGPIHIPPAARRRPCSCRAA
jgi:hypothetical protein